MPTLAAKATLAGDQGTTFGEEGLEKEAHKEKKKVWDSESHKIRTILYFYFC